MSSAVFCALRHEDPEPVCNGAPRALAVAKGAYAWQSPHGRARPLQRIMEIPVGLPSEFEGVSVAVDRGTGFACGRLLQVSPFGYPYGHRPQLHGHRMLQLTGSGVHSQRVALASCRELD